jgi:hypothetical protein
MPGKLRCGVLDLSRPEVFSHVLEALRPLMRDPRNRHPLQLKGHYHFTTTSPAICGEPGWYVIHGEDGLPLYVGTAENLNARLNSDAGSRDRFADPQRTSDPTRNFIKAFMAAGTLTSLSVVTITEPDLRRSLGLTEPLGKLDRENIEKLISMFRAKLCGLAAPKTYQQ